MVFPYYGPWSWMNRQARSFVDELVDAVYARYSLPTGTPLICTGSSMGGCTGLLHTRHTAVADERDHHDGTEITMAGFVH